jgi:hypothetical protein
VPRANWGIDASDVEAFYRSKQFAPYTGPVPPNGVYEWLIKVLKYVPRTADKNAQLRIGLELSPRDSVKGERKYRSYFVMGFRSITPKNQFAYVPFLDAIGVSANDFTKRTIVDSEGNISQIGKWRQDGGQYILAQLVDKEDQHGQLRKDIGWMGMIVDVDEDDDAADIDDDDEYVADDEDDEYADDDDDGYVDASDAF